MRTCKVSAVVFSVLLLGSIPWARATDPSGSGSLPHVVPVLVSVDKQGKVTEVLPAYHLRPKLQRMIEDTLRRMITGPSIRNGKPVDSQSIIQLRLDSVRQANGRYKVSFSYLGAKPVPIGSWHWVHQRHPDRMALAPNTSSMQMPDFPHYGVDNPGRGFTPRPPTPPSGRRH